MFKKKKSHAKQLRLINTPVYNYRETLYKSFFSTRLYTDVANRWQGLGINYFIFLLLFGCLPFSIHLMVDFNRFFNEQILTPLRTAPAIHVQNGIVYFNRPMPYIIKNKLGQTPVIIDTTGQVTTLNDNNPYLFLLLTKTQLIYRAPKFDIYLNNNIINNENKPSTRNNHIYTLESNFTDVIHANQLIQKLHLIPLKYLCVFLIYPLLVTLFFGMFLVFLLSIAMLARLTTKMFFKISLSYPQACRLLIVSSTPYLLSLLLLLAINWFPHNVGCYLLALLAVYFNFSVLAFKRASRGLVPI